MNEDACKPWRNDPQLSGRFHPEAHDDLQVVVHDGGPRTTDRHPETVWVTVTGMTGDVFDGRVLNQPDQLESVREGDLIRFLAPSKAALPPVMVTGKILAERSDWIVQPCTDCGSEILFDAPSDIIRRAFPDIPEDAQLQALSTFCGGCGGVQVLQHRDSDFDPPRRRWWEFWK